jgi:formylglycine-generating enzyme required for sulfatase activity
MSSKNWAITIGINHYNNLKNLRYAVRDAEAVRDFFQQEIKFEQVYHFSDNAAPIPAESGASFPATPTFGNLWTFLGRRFEQPFMESGDNFWLFFVGHGIRHEDRDYLIPSDGDSRYINNLAIPVSHITERLQGCGADNVILLLDACRVEERRSGPGFGTELQKGVVTLYACSPDQASYEIEELEQGSFTYSLLEGLRLRSPDPNQNCATVERLEQYLRYRVPELNLRYQRSVQNPYARIEPLNKKHLILLPQWASLEDVKTLKLDALEAEAEQDFEVAEQLWVRVLAASPADGQAIKAIKRLALQVHGTSTTPNPAPPTPKDDSHYPTPAQPQPVSARPSTPTGEELPPATQQFYFETVQVNKQGKVIARENWSASLWVEDLGNGIGLEMVRIPGGTFVMGSPESEAQRFESEGPQHEVTLQSFLIGRYPVTQAQWRRVAGLPIQEIDLESDPSHFKGADRPVETVSWYEAVEFCARLSKATGRRYGLPTEAEWEYACRAGSTTPFYFGETITPELANYDGRSTYDKGPKGKYVEKTTPVGQYPPNAWGLYDMHGQVWQWCMDKWHDIYRDKPQELKQDGHISWLLNDKGIERRTLRGGSWSSSPRICRSAIRDDYHPDVRDFNGGFRVVCLPARALP